jgi:copper chaperone
MSTLKFKTNIKCAGCIAAVTPHLNAVKGIEKWEVDLANPDRILTVNTEGVTFEDVKAALSKAGYNGEQVN